MHGFLFRNPGLLRVPEEQALRGGESDCRNRTLHQMFLMINLGERAGSGLPKIRQGWEQEGGTLHLLDSFEPYDQTKLEMSLGNKMSVTRKTPEKILGLLRATPTMTIAELASRIEKSESAVERAIRKLRKSGRLERIGPDKGGHWKVIDD